jgi:8-amino-7-oxononanoate synthase
MPSGDAPIVPIILGGEAEALAASRAARESGLLIPAIRPPTVPQGSSRLRVTLSCDHTDAEISGLLRFVKTISDSLRP